MHRRKNDKPEMNKPIYFFKDYLMEHFGEPLYRIPIDLGFSCPHRNISRSSGCIFCNEDGARAIHLHKDTKLEEQIKEGIRYIKNRYNVNNDSYIAYLQSYTNTNADIQKIKDTYEYILRIADFKVLIIATRPDCLPLEILNYLSELSERIEIWVELGVQTTNNDTLTKINRAHTFEAVKTAVVSLNKLNIKTSAHIIIGLPDEQLKDNLETVREITALPFSGIKFHNLLILKNSPLGSMYNKKTTILEGNRIHIDNLGCVNLYNEYEYVSILIELLRRIPPNWPVMRIIAEADEKQIILPKWNLSKGRIIKLTENLMNENNFKQGDLYKANTETISDSLLDHLKIKTADNSYTFYSPEFRENYHSTAGAHSEALNKFVVPANFEYYLGKKSELNILDIGFGLGYNAFAAINYPAAQNSKVNIITLEYDTKPLCLALSLYRKSSPESKILNDLLNTRHWTKSGKSITIKFGDARKTIQTLTNYKFDVIFLDAFSTTKNPELWSYDFIKHLKLLLSNDGVILTYSAAYSVKGAFLRNKLYTGETRPFGRKNGGTIATRQKEMIQTPISERDLNITLKSTAGTPYRDPTLSWPGKKIISCRSNLIRKLKQKGIPKWFK